jgi:hypothetical protein
MVSLTALPQHTIDVAAEAARQRHIGLAVIHPPSNRLTAIVPDFEI